MIKSIRLKTKTSNYSIIVGNNSFKRFMINLKKEESDVFILIDTNVYKNFKSLINKFRKKNFHVIKVKSSEKIKSFQNYQNFSLKLIQQNINRTSIIIAIGGGTLGDLAGFVASTILRGVKFILVPTTLLSQVDSSVGGKNGINTQFGKNLIGTFYQPNEVIIDPIFLKFLPYREIKSGYAEIVKHAIINDYKFFRWLDRNFMKIFRLQYKELIYAIEKSIKIKAKFVMQDEKELLKSSSSRAILNFGHTFGHALESLNNYKSSLTHGEAISTGMIIAAKISNQISGLPKYQLNQIISHFKNCNLPTHNNLIKNKKFYSLLIKDKKNQNKKINIILIKKIGNAFFAKNFEINKIKKLILKTI
tara:strand:- start:6013 stop:7098 length:1086 start_codon:yes stop_codon:yes gene_type:complete